MLNTLKNDTLILGYNIKGGMGGTFTASNDDYIINFIAEGRNGGLYTKCLGYYDKHTKRTYQAQRYLYKFIGVVQGIGYHLGENNILWDYKTQEPFRESKIKAMQKVDKERTRLGKTPLYTEYLKGGSIMEYETILIDDFNDLLNLFNLDQLPTPKTED
jgi:hypothetical protein